MPYIIGLLIAIWIAVKIIRMVNSRKFKVTRWLIKKIMSIFRLTHRHA